MSTSRASIRSLRRSCRRSLHTRFLAKRGAHRAATICATAGSSTRSTGQRTTLMVCHCSACGVVDGYWEHVVRPWDVAAGALITLEAGGALSGTDGSPFGVDAGHVLATNSRLHPAMTELLAGI